MEYFGPLCSLKNLVSKHDVYLTLRYSVTHWSSLTCNKTEVLNVSGHVAACELVRRVYTDPSQHTCCQRQID